MITILTNLPIKQTLTKPEKSRRVAKWAIELGEHDIVFQERDDETPKDFLIDVPREDNKKEAGEKDDTNPKKMELSCEWKLFTDGAVSSDGSDAGLMLIDPEGKNILMPYEDLKESRKIRVNAPQYKLIRGNLYSRSFYTSWLRCVASPQTDDIINETGEMQGVSASEKVGQAINSGSGSHLVIGEKIRMGIRSVQIQSTTNNQLEGREAFSRRYGNNAQPYVEKQDWPRSCQQG
ncbi:hypothetical protein Tco_0767804 [Tanacetum coccineum]